VLSTWWILRYLGRGNWEAEALGVENGKAGHPIWVRREAENKYLSVKLKKKEELIEKGEWSRVKIFWSPGRETSSATESGRLASLGELFPEKEKKLLDV